MKRPACSLLAVLVAAACLLPSLSCSGKEERGGGQSPAEWIRSTAHPLRTLDPEETFDDLAPFGQMVGDARVVCLGESRHDLHEQFLFKHRLTRYLVEELGFTLFLLEESFVISEEVNAFLLEGKGTPQNILSESANWFAWETEEMVDLLSWMRAYNERSPEEKRIRFYGLDITDPLAGIEAVLDYLDRFDRPYRKAIRGWFLGLDLFSRVSWQETLSRYSALSGEERTKLMESYTALVNRLESKRPEYVADSSEKEYERVLRYAIVARESQRLYLSDSRTEGGLIRDRAMADNALWVLKNVAPGERAVLWAHNVHVAKAEIEIAAGGAPETGPVADLVSYLYEEMGKDLFSVVFTFGRSADPYVRVPPLEPGSVEHLLAGAATPRLLLDLRSAPAEGPVRAWLDQPAKLQMEDGYLRCRLDEAYDALFFVHEVRRTRPTRSAIIKFRELGVR
jgi:erythromycin esterase